MAEPSANQQQNTYWNEQAGPRWVRSRDLLDRQLADIGNRLLDRAGVRAGERVLDVGCGCGASSLEIASRVGSRGAVVGLDISRVMLDEAETRAARAGVENLRFECADAQTFAFDRERFDLLTSRFGVMFFEDSVAAFANLGRALRPGGRLSFVCWQPIAKNPWMLAPMAAAAEHLELPGPPAPDAPGPFAFGDPQRVREILGAAGFVDVGIEALEQTMVLGGDLELADAVDFIVGLGPTASLLAAADEETRDRVRAAVHEAIAPFHTAQGVRMPSAAWIATAQIG